MMILAYRTTMHGIESIVFAESRGKARWYTVLSARDAGFGGGMPDVRCKRAPEYDCRRTKDGSIPLIGGCINERLLRSSTDTSRTGKE